MMGDGFFVAAIFSGARSSALLNDRLRPVGGNRPADDENLQGSSLYHRRQLLGLSHQLYGCVRELQAVENQADGLQKQIKTLEEAGVVSGAQLQQLRREYADVLRRQADLQQEMGELRQDMARVIAHLQRLGMKFTWNPVGDRLDDLLENLKVLEACLGRWDQFLDEARRHNKEEQAKRGACRAVDDLSDLLAAARGDDASASPGDGLQPASEDAGDRRVQGWIKTRYAVGAPGAARIIEGFAPVRVREADLGSNDRVGETFDFGIHGAWNQQEALDSPRNPPGAPSDAPLLQVG